jgi:hypothetical protein
MTAEVEFASEAAADALPASAARAELPRTAPKALSARAAVRLLREIHACPHRAIARSR